MCLKCNLTISSFTPSDDIFAIISAFRREWLYGTELFFAGTPEINGWVRQVHASPSLALITGLTEVSVWLWVTRPSSSASRRIVLWLIESCQWGFWSQELVHWDLSWLSELGLNLTILIGEFPWEIWFVHENIQLYIKQPQACLHFELVVGLDIVKEPRINFL